MIEKLLKDGDYKEIIINLNLISFAFHSPSEFEQIKKKLSVHVAT